MDLPLTVLVIMIFLVGMVLKFLSSGEGEVSQSQGAPVKIDFIFFNSDGLKCKDGQVINCNLIIHGFSDETFSRELIYEKYLKSLQKLSLLKNPDWFFAEKDKCYQLFLSEFKKMRWPIVVGRLEVAEISYADECFTDKEIAGKYDVEESARYRTQVEEKFSKLDEERELQEQRFREERDRAIKKAEEEAAAAIARVEEENRILLDQAEKEYKEALKREEELIKKNNLQS